MAALHDQIYLTAAVTLTAFQYGLTFTRHFRHQAGKELFYMSICLRHKNVESSQSFKPLIVFSGVTLAEMLASWILYFSSRRFVRARSKGNPPPAIFGRYRRNVVSFNETIFYNTITVFGRFVCLGLLLATETMINQYVLATMFSVVTFMMMVRAFKDPFLFRPKSKVKVNPKNEGSVFYVQAPQIVPRIDTIPPTAQVSVLNHRIILVQPTAFIPKSILRRDSIAPPPPDTGPNEAIQDNAPPHHPVTGINHDIIFVKPANNLEDSEH